MFGATTAGITLVRNEADIITDTLDHMAEICDAGIYVYDDASTDNTRILCESHPAVKRVIGRHEWTADRYHLQGSLRGEVLKEAQKDNPDWIIVFDADERFEFKLNSTKLEWFNAVAMRLFDFYITEEDKDKTWKEREWCGPEYREIPVMFRNTPNLKFVEGCVRIPFYTGNTMRAGWMKHYSKAISVERWEHDCDFYSSHDFPERFKKKWTARRGKAIHNKSDFGAELIKWTECKDKGFLLND